MNKVSLEDDLEAHKNENSPILQLIVRLETNNQKQNISDHLPQLKFGG